MNREQEIRKAGHNYKEDYGCFNCDLDDVYDAFCDGAKWADENVSWDVIVEIWNLATTTAIAQVTKEMSEFKSQKEVTEYIKQKLGL